MCIYITLYVRCMYISQCYAVCVYIYKQHYMYLVCMYVCTAKADQQGRKFTLQAPQAVRRRDVYTILTKGDKEATGKGQGGPVM